MISINPVNIDTGNFSDFGQFYNLIDSMDENVKNSSGEGYTDGFTLEPIIDRLGSLGMTNALCLPTVIFQMERHLHTQEAMFCAGEPIAFLVSCDKSEYPDASSVKGFILNPGEVVVINRGIWHSAAVGIKNNTSYYWMAEAYDDEPTVWRDINKGPVYLAEENMVKTMSNYTVFLGDVALDEYYKTNSWPEIGGKAFIDQLDAQHGGMIANAACVYAALGGNARFMTPLNCGEVSKILVRGLEESKVYPNYIIWDDSLADSKCLIFLTEDNNTVMIVNTGLNTINISKEYFEVLKKAEYIYSTVSDLLRLRYNDLKGMEIISELRKFGVKIICDLDTGYLDNDSELNYMNLDIVVFNHIGFEKYKNRRSKDKAISDLLSYGISLVAITYGDKGCEINTDKESIKIPAYKVDSIDVTGAGDTFSAALLYGIQNMSIKDAAKFASATAAICVQNVGARGGMVSKNQVLDFMRNYDENLGNYPLR